MKHSKLFFTVILLILNSTFLIYNSSAQCLQVESILVDACNNAPCPGTATEGENEMVLFKVGSTALTVGYMSTTATASLTPSWPNNSFKGWQTPGAITNPLVAALNTTIIKCGYLVEPVGGILPANSQVLIISSTNMCTAGNSFANLTDTLYVLFQIAGNTLGHFANNDNSGTITPAPTGSVSPRTFTLAYAGSVSCSESVIYDRSLLVNIVGTYGGGSTNNDGATVQFDAAGVATYVNNGCQAPYIPINVSATAPSTVCVNSTANLGASISGPAVNYSWTTSGTGTISVPTGTLSGAGSSTINTTYTPGTGESGAVSFTLTAQGKCALDIVTSTVSVNVIALPSPIVTSSNGTVVCNGNNTVLSVNNEAGVSYTWNPGAGNGTSFTVSPTSQTIYTATATNICASIDATFTVDVNALPNVSVTSASVCPGFTATITASGASTYTWNTSAVGSSISDSPATTTQYTATGTDGNGCVNTSTGTIFVFNSPTVTVNSPVICIGGTATLTAGGASTFTWSTTQTGNSISDNPSTNTSYTVVGTDTNGCTNFAVSSVTVNPLPTITVASATICPGDSATLTAIGASTYTWSTTSTNPSITVSPSSTTPYSVTATDVNGCQNTATATVSVVNSLTVSASPASTVICNGSSTSITGNGAATYTWSSAASLSSSTGSTVTASPTVTTTYTVVGSSGSCKDSSVVTINVNNLPTVSGASTQSVVCPGSSVTLTGSGASTYSWSGGVTDGVAFTPSSTQTYTVTGTDVNGCTNSANVTVTINTINITTASTATAICAGSPNNATLTASGGTSYTWSPASSLSSSTGVTVTASPTITTTYTVIGMSGTCVDSTTVTITVNAPPAITANANANPVCQGSSVTLTGGGGLIYVWTGGVSNATPFTPTSTQTYTVAGIGSNGCSGFAAITVTVNLLPIITVNASIICMGQTATLNAAGANSYTWNPAATLSSVTGSSVTATPTTTSNYTVTGTDANGCMGQQTTTVTVNPLPNIIINPSNPSLCTGATTTLSATPAGTMTYTWSTSNVGNSISVNPAATTSYSVLGTDGNGCVSSQTTTVTVNPLPIITAGSVSVCLGSNGTLSASGASTYTWSNGQNGASITIPGTAGSYTVTGTSANGCINSTTTSVSVFALPTANFSPNIYTGQVPATVVFTNTSTSPTGTLLTNYWNFGNGDSSYQVSPSETYSSSGTYGVLLTVTDVHGCWDTASATIVVTDVPVIIVVPNVFSPNGDNINDLFTITGNGIDKFSCKIYDRWGIFLYEWSDIRSGWDGKNVSNGKDVTDGTYYFILSYSDNKSKPFTKQGYLQLLR